MEFGEERDLEFTITMVVWMVRLEDFAQPLKQETAEFVESSKVVYALGNVSGVVVIRVDRRYPVELEYDIRPHSLLIKNAS